MASQGKSSYTGDDIQVLEGLDPVRKRPGMYIGGTGKDGYHHLLWEVVDNSIDEVINKHATKVEVTLHKDGKSATAEDNGRGIPVDTMSKFKKSALEVIFSTLHSGGKFERGKSYAVSGGLHGVGAAVVNALSSERARHRGQARWRAPRDDGSRAARPRAKLKNLGAARGSGTTIKFTARRRGVRRQAQVRPRRRSPSGSRPRATCTAASRSSSTTRRQTPPEDAHVRAPATASPSTCPSWSHDRKKEPVPPSGGVFYVEKQRRRRQARASSSPCSGRSRPTISSRPTSTACRPPTAAPTTPACARAIVKAVRNHIATHKLEPKGVTLTAEDIREGVVAVLSTYVHDPQFQSQTKNRLNNPEVAAQVEGLVRPRARELPQRATRTGAQAVVARTIISARAREASRAAQQVTRKTAVSASPQPARQARRLQLDRSGRVASCSSSRVTPQVARPSRAATASTQAILPLRGKVLNAEQANNQKLLANKELQDIVSALGCGMGDTIDVAKLRYSKIFLLMDADADGHHIATLLLTFFFRYMRPLIEQGHVYLAQPPLYRIDIGKQTFWALDDGQRDRLIAEHGKANSKPNITRFKGLGEMNPDTLKSTTLDPKTRQALRVKVKDGEQLLTDQTISDLMGKDVAARFKLITENAGEIGDLDV